MRLKITLYTVLLLLLIAFPCFANPTILSTSGTIADGQSLTITGGSFGTKSTSAPVKWDNFEGGTSGSTIGNGWSYHPAESAYDVPYYSDDNPRTGRSLFIRCPFIYPKYGCVFYKTGETSEKANVYVTFYMRMHKVSGATTTNYKFCYITSSATSFAGAMPRYCWQGNVGSYYATSQSDNDGESFSCYSTEPTDNAWKRVEMYVVESSGGATQDGKVYFYKQDNTTGIFTAPSHCTYGHDSEACQTRDTGHLVNAHFGIYCGDRTGGQDGDTYYYDYSDIYFDNTWARVEVGNNATWANCTHREIQVPSSWSATSITITLNKGSFDSLNNQYLFVVDSNGNVSSGHQLINVSSTGGTMGGNANTTTLGSGGGSFTLGN